MKVVLQASWLKELQVKFKSDYMRGLSQFLRQKLTESRTFYPPPKLIFNALNTTPLPNVKAVILGLMLRNQCPRLENIGGLTNNYTPQVTNLGQKAF